MNTEKQRSTLIYFLYTCMILFLFYIFFRHIIYYILPFFIGFAISFCLRPIIKYLTRISHGYEKTWSILIILLFYATIGILLSYLAMRGYVFLKDFLNQLPSIYQNSIEPFLQSSFNQVQSVWASENNAFVEAINSIWQGLKDSISSIVSNVSSGILYMLSDFVTSLPHLFISFFMAILSSFFFNSDYSRITTFLLHQFSSNGKQVIYRTRHFVVETIGHMVIANIKLMSLTLLELCVGLSVLRVEHALMIALLICLFDALPIFGTGGILLPWICIEFFHGMNKLALGLLILYLIITLVRTIIEPKILGKQLGLHPLIMLLCMYLGAKLFGFFGFLCLPIIILVLRNLNEEGFIHLYET